MNTINELNGVQDLAQAQAASHKPQATSHGASRSSAAHLVFYTFLVIDVCLCLFNAYLFYLIWASLSGSSDSLLFASQEAANTDTQAAAHLDLLSSWTRIKTKSQLVSFTKELEAKVLSGDPSGLLFKSQAAIQLGANARRTLVELTSANSTTRLATIRFPSGVHVKAPSGELQLACEAHGVCRVGQPRRVLLARVGGVQMNRKSVQANLLQTSRLHSRTRWLRLWSTNSSHFRSKEGKLSVETLDDISLLSQNSAVIIQANDIHVDGIRGLALERDKQLDTGHRGHHAPQNRSTLGSIYKLCVCLPVHTTSAQMPPEAGELNTKLGLVFGVGPTLSCAKFSGAICGR